MLTTQTRRTFAKCSLPRLHKHAHADNTQGVELNIGARPDTCDGGGDGVKPYPHCNPISSSSCSPEEAISCALHEKLCLCIARIEMPPDPKTSAQAA